jgi:hypothetical protein
MTSLLMAKNMPTSNSPQFGIEAIAYFKWDKSKASLLKRKRLEKGLSMKQLSQQIAVCEVECSLQYIDKLENGNAESIKSDKFITLLKCLNVDMQEFFPFS